MPTPQWLLASWKWRLLASQPRLSAAATAFLCRSHHLLAAACWDCAPEICISSSSAPNVRYNYLPSLYHTLDPALQHQGCCHLLLCWHKLSSGCVSLQGFCGVARLSHTPANSAPQMLPSFLDLWITGLWPCSCTFQTLHVCHKIYSHEYRSS